MIREFADPHPAAGYYQLPTEDLCALYLGPSCDELPAGLTHHSQLATIFESGDHRRAAQQHYAHDSYADMRQLLRLFVNPGVRVAVRVTGHDTELRISAAWHESAAALIVQHSSVATSFIRPVALHSLHQALINELGEITRGTQQYFTAAAAEVNDEERPFVLRSGPSVAEQYHHWFVRRRAGTGTAVVLGPAVGPPRQFGGIHWYLIENDGGYLETRNSEVTVRAAGSADLSAALQRCIAIAAEDSRWG